MNNTVFNKMYKTVHVQQQNICFDVASMSPCFCSAEAPDEPDKARRKLTFRRLLLNKCQEEFEKGDVAMAAVAAREKKKEEGGEEEDKVRVFCGVLCVISRGFWRGGGAGRQAGRGLFVGTWEDGRSGDVAMAAVAAREMKKEGGERGIRYGWV
jgi:hypothetical protein